MELANREDIRNYYRKSAGFLALISSIWLLVMSGLAIYISDMAEVSDVSNSFANEAALYGYYGTFFFGIIIVLLLIVGGLIGIVSKSEAIFKFLRIMSFLSALISAIYFVSIYVTFFNSDTNWTNGFTVAIFWISFVSSIINFVASVTVFVLTVKGLKYYDGGKKMIKDAPEITKERLDRKFIGYNMLAFIALSVCVYMLSLYFKFEIISYDDSFAADNTKYINLFNRVFIAGMVFSAIHMVITVCLFATDKWQIMYGNKIALLGQMAASAFFVIICVSSFSKDFVKSNAPDAAYMYFAFVIIGINIIMSIKAFRAKTNFSQKPSKE